MSLYTYLFVFLVLLAGVCTVDADILYLNQTHGETWIKWNWQLEASDYGSPEVVAYYLDGSLIGTYDLIATPIAMVPTEYFLSNAKPSELHSMHVVLLDNSSIPATMMDEKTLSATTRADSTYFYVVLALGFILFVLSLFLLVSRMVLIGLFLDVGAVMLFGYLATAAYQFSPALSTISIILGIMSIIPIIYALYKAYENSQNWRE